MSSRSSALKDTLMALGIVAGVLLALYVYAGSWPPMVVVESGSMMHCDPEEGTLSCPPRAYGTSAVPFGRYGTIDPGDLVVVKSVDAVGEIALWVDGYNPDGTRKGDADLRYGEPGDVIVYHPNGDASSTPIIHRAITYVKPVMGAGNRVTAYEIKWWNGTLSFPAESGITIREPEMGIMLSGYKPTREGFLTKGDNPLTNTQIDQETSISRSGPVAFSFIQGKARLELPWFGLIKLGIAGKTNEEKCELYKDSPTMKCHGWWKLGYAWAPSDLWISLLVSLGVLIIAPFGIDFAQEKLRQRRAAEQQAQAPTEPPASAPTPPTAPEPGEEGPQPPPGPP